MRDEPTEEGDAEVRLLTDVPPEAADAMALAGLYLRRWRIESAFQEMTEHPRCEVDTLGYPRAALLGFALAACAYDLLAVMKGAVAAVHGRQKVERELSTHALAQEMTQHGSGLAVALPGEYWERFGRMSPSELAGWLLAVARRIRWGRYQKARRSAKKPPPAEEPPRRKGSRRRAHVSTARALDDLNNGHQQSQ